MSQRSRRGFTLIELLVVVVVFGILALLAMGAAAVGAGNLCYTERGVLAEVQVDHPDVAKVLRTERHAFRPSIVVVAREDGSRMTFELRTSIFFNYHLKEVPSTPMR